MTLREDTGENGTIPWEQPWYVAPADHIDGLELCWRVPDDLTGRVLTVFVPFAALECYISPPEGSTTKAASFEDAYRWLVAPPPAAARAGQEGEGQ